MAGAVVVLCSSCKDGIIPHARIGNHMTPYTQSHDGWNAFHWLPTSSFLLFLLLFLSDTPTAALPQISIELAPGDLASSWGPAVQWSSSSSSSTLGHLGARAVT